MGGCVRQKRPSLRRGGDLHGPIFLPKRRKKEKKAEAQKGPSSLPAHRLAGATKRRGTISAVQRGRSRRNEKKKKTSGTPAGWERVTVSRKKIIRVTGRGERKHEERGCGPELPPRQLPDWKSELKSTRRWFEMRWAGGGRWMDRKREGLRTVGRRRGWGGTLAGGAE